MSTYTNRLAILSFITTIHWSFLYLITGIYGLSESHQIPNIPCDRSANDVFLNQHLQWYHNFDSVSARKLVRAISNNVNQTESLFSIYESVLKQNICVENYKCMFDKKPFL